MIPNDGSVIQLIKYEILGYLRRIIGHNFFACNACTHVYTHNLILTCFDLPIT